MSDYKPPVTIGADVDMPEPLIKGPSAPVQQNVEEVRSSRRRPPKDPTPLKDVTAAEQAAAEQAAAERAAAEKAEKAAADKAAAEGNGSGLID